MPVADAQPILELRKVRRVFPGVLALDGVDFDLRPGEVHCLAGENGAGKSTLMKVVSGAYRMSSGEIRLEGRPIEIRNPRHARGLGVSVIYQELNLFPRLSVGENIFIGRERPWLPGVIDQKRIHRGAEAVLNDLGVDLDPQSPVGRLGVAEMQMVEVAKALAFDCKILIMDEPTSALTDREIAALFAAIRRLQARGVAVIYVSHRLEELFQIGSRVTVMRDGRVVATHDVGRVTKSQLIREMVDRDVGEHFPRRRAEPGKVVLRAKGLHRGARVRDVSLTLRAGEIVGLAGLMGAGRTELARALFGADRLERGEIELNGAPIRRHHPRAAIQAGIGLLTEDRKGEGLVLRLSVRENVTLPALRRLSRLGVVRTREERSAVAASIEELRIKTPGMESQALHLSGGNQQKVVLAKWLGMKAKVLIFDEPTRGIDVGAKMEIYHLMNGLAAEGVAILMISSDLPELLGMSDRILVMSRGRIVAELDRADATQEKILRFALQEAP